ncbi:hypothetical protein LCGC14_0246410 [marine sediment metagenome]|uniref:Uncharacterized protein n=1 Tax=marine sediment metagenome TaxID=412755 RepID=A0A0F9U6A2_9ZZZZ
MSESILKAKIAKVKQQGLTSKSRVEALDAVTDIIDAMYDEFFNAATDIGAGSITNAQLAGSITSANLAGSILATKLAGSIPNTKLIAGILSADAPGRALVATDFVDAATLLLKVADGAFADNAATRALFADDIWTVAKLAVPKIGVITETVAFGAFTNETGTALGNIDLGTDVPVGGIPLGCRFEVTTGFTGDTTAIIQCGVSSDLDRFTLNVDQSVLAAGVVGSVPATDGADGMAAVQTPRITITGGADWDNISAGELIANVYYLETQ